MNPAKTALDIVARPAGAVANVLNRPTAFGRNRPLYGLNLLDACLLYTSDAADE